MDLIQRKTVPGTGRDLGTALQDSGSADSGLWIGLLADIDSGSGTGFLGQVRTVSGTGSDGELSAAGRETEYYHDCMGGNGMLFTGHGIDFCQERAVFL